MKNVYIVLEENVREGKSEVTVLDVFENKDQAIEFLRDYKIEALNFNLDYGLKYSVIEENSKMRYSTFEEGEYSLYHYNLWIEERRVH